MICSQFISKPSLFDPIAYGIVLLFQRATSYYLVMHLFHQSSETLQLFYEFGKHQLKLI